MVADSRGPFTPPYAAPSSSLGCARGLAASSVQGTTYGNNAPADITSRELAAAVPVCALTSFITNLNHVELSHQPSTKACSPLRLGNIGETLGKKYIRHGLRKVPKEGKDDPRYAGGQEKE